MFDFLKVTTEQTKKKVTKIYPSYYVKRSKDLMIRGGDFYAIWDETANCWCKDEDRACAMIDKEIEDAAKSIEVDGEKVILKLSDSNSNLIARWHRYVQKDMRDNFHPLDEKLIFSNTETAREDYSSKRLDYPLEEGNCESYEELMSTLYSPEERRKLEWAIGAVISGESKNIQKFIVLYGSAGTGKSTVLNIIQELFNGYWAAFDAKSLGNPNSSFAMEPFKTNPLIAIQHDGDLSKIEDNTRLNSIVSHEPMTLNEKFKSSYEVRLNSFLFMGTNKPVRITDSRSGILRRLIDVTPSGKLIDTKRYGMLMSKIKFELGAIAKHCLDVFNSDPHFYDSYRPIMMLGASNDFYNYILDSYDVFNDQEYVTLKQAWTLYKNYCTDANVPYPFSMRVVKEELKSYFEDFKERIKDKKGNSIRNVYYGFLADKFAYKETEPAPKTPELKFDKTESLFDELYSKQPAQYASKQETPQKKWSEVETKLGDLDTTKLHYVRVPKNHIVIDFDLKNEKGEKSYRKNLEEAKKWPLTYAELSKSGKGIHLHYIYDGDVDKLSRLYAPEIEVKVFTGKSSLRRMLTKCNDIPIATINSGLPLKGDKKVVNFEAVKSEKGLRALILKNLKKEIHPGTKPSVDFIFKILDDAYNSDLHYDITDMRPDILAFASKSTNHPDYCLKMVNKMKYKSEDPSKTSDGDGSNLTFFDVEVFPNLFVVVYKQPGLTPVRMINPSPSDIESLIKKDLVGFNCRRYDNHILYARLMGYNNLQLYNQSQRIVNGSKNAFFGEAYNLSYADVYDFSSKKQSLKKFEIELGIHHQELGLKWDEPVPEELWGKVADYCINDVVATEAVFYARHADFVAREILAELSGLTVNDTNRLHITKIILGDDKNPPHVYTDLATGKVVV